MNHYLFAMAPQTGEQGGAGSLVSTFIMFGAIFFIFYFMIIRPQQKKQKEREKLLSEIQKGDKVVTGGGLHGTVQSIDETTVILAVADNVKLKFERSAIATVTNAKGADKSKESKETKETDSAKN